MYSIKVTNIKKRYFLYNNPAEVLLSKIFPGKKTKGFHALKGISFKVRQGETIGIVGHNGSGKSTLLQIITGVLEPTKGEVNVNGRIAALLELGSGFNPEFTGLENVYFNASVIGLKKKEIDERLEKILSFADIGEFIHRPVKTYSSGMMLRLAFSVMINIDPDLLIIDEALAVGDDAFQRKCFARLEQLQKNGVTIILVSHSAGQVISLCDRVILLDHGELLLEGNPREVIKRYHKLLSIDSDTRENYRDELKSMVLNANPLEEADANEINPTKSPISSRSASTIESGLWYDKNGAKIYAQKIIGENGEEVEFLKSKENYTFCYEIKFLEDCFDVSFGMMIRTIMGVDLGGAISSHKNKIQLLNTKKDEVYQVKIMFTCNLRNGSYFLNCGCHGTKNDKRVFLNRGVDILNFKVIDECLISTGSIDFSPQYKVEKR